MTDHANLDGTIEYVKNTGAKQIVVDAARPRTSTHAASIAEVIKNRLDVRAIPSHILNP